MDQDREKMLQTQDVQKTAPTPRRSYYKTPRFWVVFGGAVLLCGVIGLALALFLPLLVGNPVASTWNAVFFDTEPFLELLEVWQDDGWQAHARCDVPSEASGLLQDFYVELNGGGDGERDVIALSIGAEQSRADLELYYDDEIVALKGLCADKEESVSFPRKGLAAALDASVFHPDSKTRYAMEEKAYHELQALLRDFGQIDEDTREIEEDFEKEVTEIVYRELKPTSEYGFSTSPFGISRKMTLELDESCVKRILELAAERAREKELSLYVTRYEQWGESVPKGLSLKIESTVVGERVTQLCVSYQSDEMLSALDAKMFFTYEGRDAAFELSLSCELSREGATVKLSSEHDYAKTYEDGDWHVRYNDQVTTELVGADAEIARTEHKIDCIYGKDGTWRMQFTGEEEQDLTLSGILVLDTGKDEFRFTVERAEGENEDALGAILQIEITESDKEVEKLAKHTPFFSFTADGLREFLREMPVKEPDQVFYDLTGLWLGSYTLDGKVLYNTEECVTLMESYI
ncbi:MAG: hypothetical protein E7624_08405, partial [Ruminococcaceae bacterium]|nr:hypothetical protein [Oscillospiraceae bacterium]